MIKKSLLLTSVLLALSSFAFTAKADFNDGVYAYAQGQYEKAWQTMMPLASNTEDPYAQYYVGVMFSKGQGVEQDYKEAADWYLKASKQGVKEAQYKLAKLYTQGKGVPEDNETAYAWYKVASHMGHKKSMHALEPTKEKLSADEFAGAQQLSEEFIEKYGEAPERKK